MDDGAVTVLRVLRFGMCRHGRSGEQHQGDSYG